MHGAPQTVFTGEGIVMTPVPVLSKSGSSSWDEGYDSIVGSLKAIQVEMDKLGLTQAGQVFVVYTQSDDAGFEYEAQIPFSGATSDKPGNNVRLAASFNGKALKFMHKGSFADMDDTYEQIANYLDARNVTALEFYIEQYHTDPRTTPPDQLLLDILVPVR
ncbi:GyrI-like domain-containing protein [Azorhizobium sp. AG788]|uniref:GyrI-like domain-containing protein n=1 Tax=Azorhizobium sp. AG788 TaxID=2183897 RepID=UPI003139BF3E